jgi:internalin A
MSTSQLAQTQAIEYLKSLYASVEVDHHGNAVKVRWGHHCEVTDTGLESLSKLTTLIELELAQMTDTRLAYLSKLVNLKRLSFQSPQFSQASWITDNGLLYLTPLVNLEHLDLGNFAEITDTGLPNLLNLKKLQSLNLTESSLVTVKGLEQLNGLSELRYLGVMPTLSLEYVHHFPKLEIVDAWDKNDSEIQYLETLNNLQELYIACSTFDKILEITDASVKTLIKFKSLKILYLWDTQISEGGLRQIQKALPNCEIDTGAIKDKIPEESEDNLVIRIFKKRRNA